MLQFKKHTNLETRHAIVLKLQIKDKDVSNCNRVFRVILLQPIEFSGSHLVTYADAIADTKADEVSVNGPLTVLCVSVFTIIRT